MTLIRYVTSLDKATQYRLAVTLLEKALPIWDQFASQHSLEYSDSVVGMRHVIANDILSRALEIIRGGSIHKNSQAMKKIRYEFMEPVVALQDDDWQLPYPVERVFYATSNLLDEISGNSIDRKEEPLISIVINQLVDAMVSAKLMTIDEMNTFLARYPRPGESDNKGADPLAVLG